MSKKKYKDYTDSVVLNHVRQAQAIIDRMRSYKLNPKSRQEASLAILLQSGLMPYIAFIIEAERIGNIVFGIDKMDLPPDVREFVDDAKKVPIVLVGNNKLQTSTGVEIDMIYNTLKNAKDPNPNNKVDIDSLDIHKL